ncbi:MAG: SUMF1/EgtB/PvdO family nonheme iron enzyme [Anaerolineales bacterium]|nr:SUMF1/EgtB/PvdO family nonheme iron enzyme [Anaerolineales bacterium]
MPKRYNLVNIRALLIEGFTAAELRDFCYDTPDFKLVHHQLAENTGKAEIVQKLLVHAEQKLLLDELLAWAEAQNPTRYASHQPYSEDDPPSRKVEPEPIHLQPSSLPVLPPSPLRVFLCHAAADKPAVRDLYHRLRSDGFQPWLDEEDLLPGQKWQREIPKAVAASDVIVVCLSNAALTKAGYVQDEIKFALDAADRQPEETIFLIPLRLEECDVPERLRGLHWVNFFDPKGYERLVRSLRKKAEAKMEAEAKAKAETEAETKVEPAVRKKPAIKPRPEIPPGDRYLGGVRDEEAMAYFREHFARLGGETKPEQKTAEPQPPAPLPQPLPRRFDFEPEMILIPAGEFLMGSDPKKDEHALENEQPQHTLYLPDYYMAKTPVTNAQYSAFVQATKRKALYDWENGKIPEGKENHPVVHVSWDDAVAYCSWLAQVMGKAYRLPSEAEWEKAARGTDGRIYPWGNKWDAGRCNTQENRLGGTTPVEIYPTGVSPYEVLDMAGNVWEWTNSLHYPYPYDPKDGRESPLAKGDRVLRGGSWDYRQRSARCACRRKDHPNSYNSLSGFRVAVSPFS